MAGHDLSHIRYKAGKSHTHTRIAIVVSKWNDSITNALYEGAVSVLLEAGVKKENISRSDVPGSYELPLGAKLAIDKLGVHELSKVGWINYPQFHQHPFAVICLGCVIQGETRHFDFICDAVANGIMNLNLETGIPVIFGVLTPDTQQQAIDRAGGKYGNKGCEAAVAALEMIDLRL